MTTYDLPDRFELRLQAGGAISIYFKGDVLFFTVTEADGEGGWMEFGDAELPTLFEGLVALTLGTTEQCSVDKGDKAHDADAETFEASTAGDEVNVIFYMWGDPTKLDEDDDGSALEVRLQEWEMSLLYVQLTALAIRKGLFRP